MSPEKLNIIDRYISTIPCTIEDTVHLINFFCLGNITTTKPALIAALNVVKIIYQHPEYFCGSTNEREYREVKEAVRSSLNEKISALFQEVLLNEFPKHKKT